MDVEFCPRPGGNRAAAKQRLNARATLSVLFQEYRGLFLPVALVRQSNSPTSCIRVFWSATPTFSSCSNVGSSLRSSMARTWAPARVRQRDHHPSAARDRAVAVPGPVQSLLQSTDAIPRLCSDPELEVPAAEAPFHRGNPVVTRRISRSCRNIPMKLQWTLQMALRMSPSPTLCHTVSWNVALPWTLWNLLFTWRKLQQTASPQMAIKICQILMKMPIWVSSLNVNEKRKSALKVSNYYLINVNWFTVNEWMMMMMMLNNVISLIPNIHAIILRQLYSSAFWFAIRIYSFSEKISRSIRPWRFCSSLRAALVVVHRCPHCGDLCSVLTDAFACVCTPLTECDRGGGLKNLARFQ